MIVRVLKTGTDAAGLMRYGFGKGTHNEHTNPHLVAGSPGLLAEWGGPLSVADAAQLGRVVEASWRSKYAEELAMAGAGPRGGPQGAVTGVGSTPPAAGHVFHAAMSIHADDPALTDAQWQMVASEFVEGMGFTAGGPGVGCTWVAFHHGTSGNGNDHIHVVVNLVNEGGGWANTSFSKRESQRVRREIEARHDFLVPLHDAVVIDERQRDAREPVGLPGYERGESRRAGERQAAGSTQVDPDRVLLQRVVRGAVQAALTEEEFVYAVLEAGVDIEPRWAAGGREQVVGYSVQVPIPEGVRPAGVDERVRYGGKKLAPDLTLGKMRPAWTANETDASKQGALALWRGELPTPPVAEDPNVHLQAAAVALSNWNDRLAGVDVTDRAAWKRETAHAAGTMSLLAARAPGRDGPALGRAADSLTRVALSLPGQGTTAPVVARAGLSEAELAARHVNLALRATGNDCARGWMAVMQQMSRTAKAIQDAHLARHEMVAATRTLAAVGASIDANTSRWEQTAQVQEMPADVRAAGRDARERAARIDATLARGARNAPAAVARVTRYEQPGRDRDTDRGI
ncbi:hypothetical protein V3G39_17925 (plasmid) [Dermatophilaceae bacterium Sec6.4]